MTSAALPTPTWDRAWLALGAIAAIGARAGDVGTAAYLLAHARQQLLEPPERVRSADLYIHLEWPQGRVVTINAGGWFPSGRWAAGTWPGMPA